MNTNFSNDKNLVIDLTQSLEKYKKGAWSTLSDDNDEVELFDVDEMLNYAFKNKDITSKEKSDLKTAWEHNPGKLRQLLLEFRQKRVDYLMTLSYDELDKSKEGLLAELKNKYLQGYEQKFFVEFGKMPANSVSKETIDQKEIDRLFQFAVNNKDIDPSQVAFMKECFKDRLDELRILLKAMQQKRIDELMNTTWIKLDKNNLLEELKTKYLEGFKTKFKEQFGIEYKA
jgi:hypothetical protein